MKNQQPTASKISAAKESVSGLLPTPPLPSDLPSIDLTENARQVLERRYVRRGQDGKLIESVDEMFWRVAYHVAKVEETWDGNVMERTRAFYLLLTSKSFFPNSPTFTGAGTPLGQLAACFVLAIADDMGRHPDGIFQTLRNAALIQQTGGGNGFSFSRLRPHGTLVNSSAGQATGPVGFLRVYDNAFGEVAQGGCLLPETLVFTSRGLLRLDEIANPQISGWQSHTLNVATDEGWRESPRAYNNGVAPVLRVHTREGISLAGTYQHRVKVMTDEGPQWRTLRDLRKGDWLLVKLGQHQGKLQALRQPTKQHGNQIVSQLPPILDEELAFFLGYLTGDGFVASAEDDHRVGVSISHTSYLMEAMPQLMQTLFGVNIHSFQKPDDRSITLVMDNRAVKEFLLINGLGKEKSRIASVPRLIRQSPPSVVGAYLRGLLEADGTLSHGYPMLTTVSPRLAEETATLLMGLGCPVRISSLMPGVQHYGSAAVYHVRIESNVGLQAWREKIGCDLRSRFVASYSWQVNTQRESVYPLPNSQYWLKPVLSAITPAQMDPRAIGHKFRSNAPQMRRSLLRYVRDERQLTRSAYDNLSSQFSEFAHHATPLNDLWFVQVQEVSEAGESLTLDLEVQDNHTYLAYGVVTHNTRRGANMGVLRVDHPDIEDFVTCKTNENAITNFNISVGITDAFMQAVEAGTDWELRFPDITSPLYKGFQGTFEQAEAAGIPFRVYKKVRARELFEKIVRQAHHNGEPGVLFQDAANRYNPVPHLYQLEATNPCFIGSTRIATDQGLLTIQQLAEMGTPFLAATDDRAQHGAFGVAYRPAAPAWKTRENTPVFQLSTRHGYTITATSDHPFLTAERGYVALADLRPGDHLLLQSKEGAWSKESRLPNTAILQEKMAVMGQGGDRATGHLTTRHDFAEQYAHLPLTWSHDLGLVMGCLVGDGWLSANSNAPLGIVFARNDEETRQAFHAPMQEWFGAGHLHERESVHQLTYGRLPYEFFKSLGVLEAPAHEKHVPASLWQAPRQAVIGFLQGLFTTDGTVNLTEAKRSCSIRLSSASQSLLQEVQMLLSNFGIVSAIRKRREAGMRSNPDGKGGSHSYAAHADYELILDKANRDLFLQEIGFINAAKQEKAAEFVRSKARRSNQEAFQTMVVAVTPAGVADVYDFTEPTTHSLIANALVAHNCGEQWLGPNENCCLGSVNLAQHFGPNGTLDWEKLCESVRLATIFLDDVVEANAYVPAVPALREAALRARRIGLGIMGLADLMYHVGIRYGSPEGQEFGAQVMEYVRYISMQTSLQLAQQRGAFPAITGSIYDPQALRWQPPTSIIPYQHDWGRPAIHWDEITQGILQYGIRNAAQTTVAPTGTIATVAGCEGYGCEPVFALAYIRHVNDNGKDLQLTYASPQFEQALDTLQLDEATRHDILDQIMREGTCQGVQSLPEDVRNTFAVSADISADEHVRMQAALQAFVDNSLSKTINFPAGTKEEEVAKAYQLAWKLGCKGITVYVTGSRDVVVLETHATADKKQTAEASAAESEGITPAAEAQAVEQLKIWHESKKPRPHVLPGYTYNLQTPLGKTFITVNENGGSQPFEVFITCAKAGSDTAAVSDALGRLISYVLRLASPVEPKQRLTEVMRQLEGIGGGRPLGFGPNRVRSLPDGVSQVLADYLADWEERQQITFAAPTLIEKPAPAEQPALFTTAKIGDLCPECGQAAVINEEGCRKCYACGYSEC